MVLTALAFTDSRARSSFGVVDEGADVDDDTLCINSFGTLFSVVRFMPTGGDVDVACADSRANFDDLEELASCWRDDTPV